MSLSDPEQRKRAIDDAIKRTFPQKELNEKQIALTKAKQLSAHVTDYMVNVLRALPSPMNYNQEATEEIVFRFFKEGFDKWTKEELEFLLSLMHTNILMEAIEARVHAGLVGEHFDAKD